MTTDPVALADLPEAMPVGWGQSLADGAPGIALPHIDRARTGMGGWEPVHRLATAMACEPVHAHPDVTTLFRGAPAVAYALHAAAHPAYRTALATLDRSITALIQARLRTAHHRIDAGCVAHAREYDLINGITGLGAYLMHRHPDHGQLRDVLTYLVRLTAPVGDRAGTLPGWWASGSPDRRQSPRWAGGHANFGMAHGIAGPLALLSAAMRRGVIVDGHEDAIRTICAWLDRWRTRHGQVTWWPEVIDRDELRTPAAIAPHRPSWCYGTPGIARAQQLAGIALGDTHRAGLAEHALIGCLTDERQLAHLTDAGLCHGWAGLVHTARRAAADAIAQAAVSTAATAAFSRLRRLLRQHGPPGDRGLLEGIAGIALVDSTAPPGWDTCMLVG